MMIDASTAKSAVNGITRMTRDQGLGVLAMLLALAIAIAGFGILWTLGDRTITIIDQQFRDTAKLDRERFELMRQYYRDHERRISELERQLTERRNLNR